MNARIGAGRDSTFAQYVQAAHQWQSVDPENMEERALSFVYHSCRNMRAEALETGLVYDTPEKYHSLDSGSVGRTASHFLYDTCRRFKYEIFTDAGRWLHNVGYQFAACGEDKVQCKKDKVQCLSTCGGSDGSQYKHDFATIISSTELSRFALGDGFDSQAAADCTVRSFIFKVPVFQGGDSFATFAARMRSRSGMTAIDQKFCYANPLSCGAIQNVLEKSPGLVFVNGEFRHKYSLVPPSPPPDPSPPPREFAYAPHPPLPPPPPVNPPPFYEDAEDCLPLPRLERLRPGHQDRRHRRRRDRGARELHLCAPRPGREAARKGVLRAHRLPLPATATRRWPCTTLRQRPASGGSASASATWRPTRRRARPTRRMGERHRGRRCSAREALIDALGENNPILRDLLATAKQEIYRRTENRGVPRPRRLRCGHGATQRRAAGSCSARSTTRA